MISRNSIPGCLALVVTTVAMFVLGVPGVQAQFLRIQLKVPTKAAYYDITMPRFGNLYPNAGWIVIPPGDPRIGSFNISNIENITVMVGIAAPASLVMNEENQLPLRIEAAWLNDGTNRPHVAIPFEPLAQNRKLTLPSTVGKTTRFIGDYATFNLRSTTSFTGKSTLSDDPLTAWVYLFGALYVGDVEPGIYKGEIFVTIEYE